VGGHAAVPRPARHQDPTTATVLDFSPSPVRPRAPRRGRLLGQHYPLVDALADVDGLVGERLEHARRVVRARTLGVRRGRWDAAADAAEHAPRGFVVIEGTLLRRVAAAHREGAELLGPGDVIQPGTEAGDEISWRAAADTVLAIIDEGVLADAAAFPELPAALLTAVAGRTNTIARQLVVAQWASADDRIVATLEILAERWGVVTPHGVALPAFLTHAVLAPLVGARRPSVTTALKRLEASGRVRRASDGRWLLAPS
jgi:CRP/FNR family transcriptional regulator, cyclic AMP receptor protein